MVKVVKADGSTESFSDEKILSSLHRVGIPEKEQLRILQKIKSHAYEQIPTSEIYSYVLDALGSSLFPYSRSKYSLKQAIMMLGPTGYPFEDFVSKLLQADGYQTRVRQTLFGKCVSHEIDVLAEKNNATSMIEAKFHNNPGTRSEIHVALYTQSRFQDVKEKYNFSDAWIVTNTKVTSDARAYAECMGIKIISWSYPGENNLRDMIEKSKLHPITMLTTLSSSQKMELLKNHVVMCKDLRSHHEVLDPFSLPNEKKKAVMEELDYICQ